MPGPFLPQQQTVPVGDDPIVAAVHQEDRRGGAGDGVGGIGRRGIETGFSARLGQHVVEGLAGQQARVGQFGTDHAANGSTATTARTRASRAARWIEVVAPERRRRSTTLRSLRPSTTMHGKFLTQA